MNRMRYYKNNSKNFQTQPSEGFTGLGNNIHVYPKFSN